MYQVRFICKSNEVFSFQVCRYLPKTEDNKELIKLLKDSGFSNLVDHMNMLEILPCTLLMATHEHIAELVPNLGQRVRLQFVLQQYKSSNTNQCNTTTEAGLHDLSKLVVHRTELLDTPTMNESLLEQMPEEYLFLEHNTLKDYLQGNLYGQQILAKYERENALDNDDNKRLAQIIIEGVMRRNESISCNMCCALAIYITKLFPNVSREIFYYERRINGRVHKRGKLLDRYHNQKRMLKRVSSDSFMSRNWNKPRSLK